MSRASCLTAALAGMLVALAGCSPTIQKPRLLNPGPASVQRYNATQFDPFPQTDMGPEIVGGRPPDFIAPVPEVRRANQHRDGERAIETQPGTSPVLVPTIPVAPNPSLPPVVMPTYPPGTTPAYPPYPPVFTPTYPPAGGSTTLPEVRY